VRTGLLSPPRRRPGLSCVAALALRRVSDGLISTSQPHVHACDRRLDMRARRNPELIPVRSRAVNDRAAGCCYGGCVPVDARSKGVGLD
jgi:hypothetical protein